MTIAFFFLITILITIYSLAPLMRAKEEWLSADNLEESKRALEAEKESCLIALKDIEFEHASNKINDQDYSELKKYYATKAAKAIKNLELHPGHKHVKSEKKTSSTSKSTARASRRKKAAPKQAGIELETDVDVLKKKIEKLVDSWEAGEFSDDQYIILYDHYSANLENLLKDRG